MLQPRHVSSLVMGCLMIPAVDVVYGQDYPNKPIRIVTAEPGGSGDFGARIIAQGISGPLGQPVVMDNRPGGGLIPGEVVAKAPPDGYTLLFFNNGFWLQQFFQAKMPYDALKDFSPITLALIQASILAVHPSLPVNSVRQLIALAKAKPGELNYGSGPIGAPSHLAVELFKNMAGVNVVRVPYRATGPALNALISGQIQMMMSSAAGVDPHIKSGRLKALAIATLKPSALYPALPTLAATLPGYEWVSITGMFAPAKTSEAIIRRLNQEIVQVLNKPDVKEKLLNAGAEAVGSSADQLAAAVRSDVAKTGKLIRDVGIRAE